MKTWLVASVLVVFIQFSESSAIVPTIEPDTDEIHLNEGDSLEIKCISDQPVTFHYSETTYKINTTIPEIIDKSNSGKFILILKKNETIYGDAGWYGCANSDVKVIPNVYDQPDVKWTYVFVKSNRSLFVENQNFQASYAEVGDRVIISCRPTSTEYQVTLAKLDEDSDGEQYFFDPKLGFVLNDVSLADNGYYQCTAKSADEENMIEIFVHIDPQTVPRIPRIEEESLRHVVQGQELKVNCSLDVEEHTKYSLNWTTPRNSDRYSTKWYSREPIHNIRDLFEVKIELIIKNVSYEDAGEYICTVQYYKEKISSNATIIVNDPSIKYINLTAENPQHIEAEYNSDVIWVALIDAHPPPILKWLDPRGEEINTPFESHKRGIETLRTKSYLIIRNVEIRDMGIYVLEAYNNEIIERLNFTLDVLTKPMVAEFRNIKTYYPPDSEVEVECHAVGYPAPNITWNFNETDSSILDVKDINNFTFTISTIRFNISRTGLLSCEASNIVGTDKMKQNLFVSDFPGGYGILAPSDNVTAGDTVEFTCGASIYNYTDSIKWKDDQGNPILENDRLKITKSTTPFSYQSSIKIKNVDKSDAMVYYCSLESKDHGQEVISHILQVYDEMKPTFVKTNLNDTESIFDTESDSTIMLTCYINGMPKPDIFWSKDNERINGSSKLYIFKNSNQELHIEHLREKHSGKYSCEAQNRVGYLNRSQLITVKGKQVSTGLVISIIILVVICIVLIVYFSIKIHKEKVIRKQFEAAGLTYFQEGALECLNPDLTVDDQAELLPYEKKWEFPREKLSFGKQLGAGAFGVVMKAEARGIIENEPVTTVAVKMVRRTTDLTYIRALASELKIMVHLGKHLNVVNLLGACTKNIAKCELLVIVEYCRYGNLHNYLLRHRADFINQIDPTTKKIDLTIGEDILRRSVSVGSNGKRIKYAALSFSRSISQNSNTTEMQMIHSAGTDTDGVTMSPDGTTFSNNSTQPGWRSNYRGDYKDYNLKPICTQDLLTWAFQVARGMEYLCQRKVLHGDLAARNILLAEDNVVKICDFGLAKTMYKNDNYKKNGDALLPLRWMAIESIRDRIFSTQSDVWSFGIVLWEFFTLAETPYPLLKADEQYLKLVEGYRMEKPEFATNNIYDIMLRCWRANPTSRPSFTELVNSIGDLLEESVKTHYLDLNTPYLDMNTTIFENGKNDYLKMMSAPDHEALSSPTEYINSPTSPVTDCSYICMSPTSTDEVHFKFPSAKQRPSVSSDSESEAVEFSPMLKSEDDNYLVPINVTERRAQFAKQRETMKNNEKDKEKLKIKDIDNKQLVDNEPRYCNTIQNLKLLEFHDVDINDKVDGNINENVKLNKIHSKGYNPTVITTQNNYINMPKVKDNLRKDIPDSFTNPSYIFIGNNNDKIEPTKG